jgi:LCP family protein required for cell wall assembly
MNKRNIILGFLLLALVAGLIFIGIPLARQWNQPLAEGLDLPTYTASPSETSTSIPTQTTAPTRSEVVSNEAADTPIPTITLTDTPAPSPTSTAEPLCGGPEVMTVMALGIDTEADNYLYGLADEIRIVRVDFVTPKLTALSIPRDIWVEIPGISDHYDITHGKLNQAYFYGTPGMGYYDGPGGGPGLFARTLDLNFGLRADHYGTINMVTFVRMVDAVGGIDVYLPHDVDGRPVDDKTEDMGYFKAGEQHFTGELALRFSRIRKIDTVFERDNRQTMVLCALKDKLLSPAVLPRIPKLIAAFQDSVITDLSPAQLTQLACLLPHLERENIIFTGLPTDILTQGREFDPHSQNTTFVWKVDFDVIRDYFERFIAGTWPVGSEGGMTCP